MKRTLSLGGMALLAGAVLVSLGCPPTLDPTLSPPVIGEPLYGCSEMVAYSGADRDATIIVYVNGTEEARIDSWLGWGAVRLPSALVTGDVVTAAQQLGSRISHQSREPVTVTDIPADELPGRRLKTPEILAPLYECQKVVRVHKVLPGAEVNLRNDAGGSWSGKTPYTVIRLGTPELVVGERYDAMQQICTDPPFTSDWSVVETVQERPATMPQARIAEPIVEGNDACLVTDLIPGAVVEISADDGSGLVRVGGGTAPEVNTIFKVDPPLTGSSRYTVTQALCDLVSTPPAGVTPITETPAPSVWQPICDGELYVTVCDTQPQSTVRVFVGGTQVAQGAGNGGCVTLALGGTAVLAAGDVVTARQEVSGSVSPASPGVTVEADAAPPYNPAYWNNPAYQSCNNCYNYGTDERTDTFAQPGYAHGDWPNPMACTDVGNAAIADGLAHPVEQKCTGCTHLAALVVDPLAPTDYHWYRLDDTGRWSHKPGDTPATDLDASGNTISDPTTADRNYGSLNYTEFCGYFCVDKDVVVIDGPFSCD